MRGKHHGDAVFIGGLDHFIVAHAAAGLDHGGRALVDDDVEPVAEREECVARTHATGGPPCSTLARDASGVEAVLLTRTDAECLAMQLPSR